MTKYCVSVLALMAASLSAQPTEPVFNKTVAPGFVRMEPMGVSSVKGAPYSADAITESVQVLADGNRIVNRQISSVARDSQGRTRNEAQLRAIGSSPVEGQPLKIVMVHDPVAQVTYTLETGSKTARKVSTAGLAEAKYRAEAGQVTVTAERRIRVPADASSGAVEKQKGEARQLILDGVNVRTIQRSPGSAKSESLGTQVIEGVIADGTRTTETIPANEIGNEKELQIVNEVWVAQDLKAVVLSKRTDPRNGEVTYKLTNIQRSEPAASLFEVPADYRLVDEASKGDVFFFKRNE